ncbi:MAG: hypothetical protein U0W40_17925 [Acidimicrobiia bacterium]
MRAHERVGPQRGRLNDASGRFRAALDAPSIESPEGDHEWCTAVAAALADLQDAWQAHVRFTEEEDGLFEELLLDNPELAAPEVDHLRRDHAVVSVAMNRAGELLGAEGAGPGEAKLRDSLTAVAKQVDAHRKRGYALLSNVYSVDPTGGG